MLRLFLVFCLTLSAQTPCLQTCGTYAVLSQPDKYPVAGTKWCWNTGPITYSCQDPSGVIVGYGGLGPSSSQVGVAVLSSDANPSVTGQSITISENITIR